MVEVIQREQKKRINKVRETLQKYYNKYKEEFDDSQLEEVYKKFRGDIDSILEYYQDKHIYEKRGVNTLVYVMEEISGEKISPKEYYENNQWLKEVVSYRGFERSVLESDTVEKRKKLLPSYFEKYIQNRDKKVVYNETLVWINGKELELNKQKSKVYRAKRVGKKYATGYKMLNEYDEVDWITRYKKLLGESGLTDKDVEEELIEQEYIYKMLQEEEYLKGKPKYILIYHYKRMGSVTKLKSYYIKNGEEVLMELYKSFKPFLDIVGGVAYSTFLKRYNLEGKDIERTMYYYFIRDTDEIIL